MCACSSQAYSLHDREVGYCQGCGFITGLLLMQVSLTNFFSNLSVDNRYSNLSCKIACKGLSTLKHF